VTGSIDSKGLARSSEGIVGLPHVLGVDGNGRINKNPSSPAYHVAKLPTWCLGSEHSEQRLRDILRRECRQESTNSFSSSYGVLISLFVSSSPFFHQNFRLVFVTCTYTISAVPGCALLNGRVSRFRTGCVGGPPKPC
jgi:hypothetical protein